MTRCLTVVKVLVALVFAVHGLVDELVVVDLAALAHFSTMHRVVVLWLRALVVSFTRVAFVLLIVIDSWCYII